MAKVSGPIKSLDELRPALQAACVRHDVILALGTEGVMPLEFAQRFAGIAGFRNIVIHEYLVVDPIKVYELLQTGPDDFRAFARYVVDYLRQSGATLESP